MCSVAGVHSLGAICHTFRNAQYDDGADADILIHYVHHTDEYQTNMDILTVICSYLHYWTCLKGFLIALVPRTEQMKDI